MELEELKNLELGQEVYVNSGFQGLIIYKGIVRMVDVECRKIGVEITQGMLTNPSNFYVFDYSRVSSIGLKKSVDEKIDNAIKEAATAIKHLGDSMVIAVKEIQKITDRINRLEDKVTDMDDDLVKSFDCINENFEIIDDNFEEVEKELDNLHEEIDEINEDLDDIYEEVYEPKPYCASGGTCIFMYDNCDCDCDEDCDEDGCVCDEDECCSECCKNCEFDEICNLVEKSNVDIIADFMNVLKSDPEIYRAWKDNIAMAYKDTWHWYKKANNCKSYEMDKHDRHNVANDAAEYFLNMVLKRVE